MTEEEMEDNYTDYINFTNFTRIPYSERPETYVVPVIFAAMFVVGLVGNGTVVHIFIKNKAMRTAPNALIISLAVGDLVVFLGTVPFTCTLYTFESWPYGEFICKASEFLRDVSVGVTVFTLTVLSFDRYLAIAWPLYRHRHNYTKKYTWTIILIVWSASIGIAFPGAYYSFVAVATIDKNYDVEICYPFPLEFLPWYPQVMVLVKFVLLYALPLFVITLFYALMAKKLMISRGTLGGNESQIKLMKVRAKVAKVVLALVIVFAICLFPNHLYMLWFYFSDTIPPKSYNQFWHGFRILGFVLTFANSCLNPLTLYFISGVYRNHYKRYLFWRCCPPDDTAFNKSMRASSTRTSRTCSRVMVTGTGTTTSNVSYNAVVHMTSMPLSNRLSERIRHGLEERVPKLQSSQKFEV